MSTFFMSRTSLSPNKSVSTICRSGALLPSPGTKVLRPVKVPPEPEIVPGSSRTRDWSGSSRTKVLRSVKVPPEPEIGPGSSRTKVGPEPEAGPGSLGSVQVLDYHFY